MMSGLNSRSRGFTLVELLVVISIIGILSSILLANLREAQSVARDSKRIAEMRSIADALEAYHARNGQYPETPDAGGESDTLFDIDGCDAGYHDLSSSDLFPTYLSHIEEDQQFCHYYLGPDYFGTDSYALYYEFEGSNIDLPRDCGDSSWGGNWFCMGQ